MFKRKKLIKTVTEKEEVAYKWVVVDLCETCAAKSLQKTETNKAEAEKSSIPLSPPPVSTSEKKVTGIFQQR
jgi:hypothetical protein